ncbi:TPA: hypothetical protein KRM68_001088 [Clostridioides difficile]|uniref:hypothetical protein n=1 Tax=Clostridioides TaxID=1870884 RepID=UPI000826F5E5|nr:hypothetical protein [Clostridioides difficile]MCC0654774.1 hypothetical protein [Clostridioides sp. ES-S-0001-03]EGT5483102.1 hypothetical protein [Clostridioides difficile]MBN5981693.1 hypothetical protein [Clostridioides difficile]MCT8897849.1 hypothetical protein [Clostridioides difficile]MCU5829688.1 hypothetical protein [Clostridioides difficile]
MMLNCSVCKNIEDYKIILTSLNISNKLVELPEKLSVGIKFEFLDLEFEKDKIKVPFNLDIIGMDKEVDEDFIDKSDDDVLFKINLVYNNVLYLENEIENKTDLNKELEKYVYFLLEPTLNETISSIGNKIGIPSLRIPKRIK